MFHTYPMVHARRRCMRTTAHTHTDLARVTPAGLSGSGSARPVSTSPLYLDVTSLPVTLLCLLSHPQSHRMYLHALPYWI
ncbi:hypothetical protein EVAR_12999_1 [Eumeta japonica]|uniref:Uncharacterized protein n=1 Tax=Eumeta variegata TaxID=151549 RepID=A0A4C1TX81_EUMVA|nr:hypothetical protein EVAR_12999_1 [Eumeta japonica]